MHFLVCFHYGVFNAVYLNLNSPHLVPAFMGNFGFEVGIDRGQEKEDFPYLLEIRFKYFVNLFLRNSLEFKVGGTHFIGKSGKDPVPFAEVFSKTGKVEFDCPGCW